MAHLFFEGRREKYFYLFMYFIFIEVELICTLVSGVEQSDSVMHIHISTLF